MDPKQIEQVPKSQPDNQPQASSLIPEEQSPLISTLPDQSNNARLSLQDIANQQLNDQVDSWHAMVLKEKGKSLNNIYSNGTIEEKQWLNRFLFSSAEQIEDPELRRDLHRFHFRLVLTNSREPQVNFTQRFGDKVPMLCTISELISDNFMLIKGRLGKDNPLELYLDYSNLEDIFLLFCERFHSRSLDPGLPILDIGTSPDDLTAVIKEIQWACFKFFGYIDQQTARLNIRRYTETGKVKLSEFRSENQSAAATCTEFSALSHEFLSLTGIVQSELISGGELNVFDSDGTWRDDLSNDQHNYQVLSYGEGVGQRIFLYDPVNYEKRVDEARGATYFWPRIEEVTPEQYHDFRQGKPISVERNTGTLDYFLPS